MTEYLLAVDGGGTKTHVLCATQDGKVVGEGMSGPTSLAATSVGAASFNLREAIRQAIEKLEPGSTLVKMVMGLAGMDTALESSQAKSVFGETLAYLAIKEFTLVNDCEVALESGTTAAQAMVIISGTGSNCFGRNAAGSIARASGMDFVLTDQGSGYAIGRATLRYAVKSFDGRAQRTELEQFVCEHFKISSIDELKNKVMNPPLTKTEVAELSQVCLRAYDQGDPVAKSIFHHAVEELTLMAKAVMTRLNVIDQPTDCVLAGSITKIEIVKTELQQQLLALNPQLNLITPTVAPVYGALQLALKTQATPQVV